MREIDPATISKARLRAMERQCVYRMGDGCPCEHIIDCVIPDGMLIADIALQWLDWQRRFEALRARWARQNGHPFQPGKIQRPKTEEE